MLRIAALYSLFAALSILVNIATQALVVALVDHRWAIPVSVLAGTATGLVAKYLLDKRLIFAHVSTGRAHEARTFILYSIAGVFTTVVFWGTEYLFHLWFRTDAMRYVGGVLGLALGYVLKYRIDRRFAFAPRQA